MMPGKERILFIVNPFSGNRKKKKIEQLVKCKLDVNRYDYSLAYIEGPGHAYDLAREAVSNGFSVVVAVGGDGSVNLVAKALSGTKVKLGIIPAGSGNGLARFLKIPLNQGSAIELLNAGKTKFIDTAKANDAFFVSIAGAGFDARVADLFALQSKRGFYPYFRLSLKEYFTYKPKTYEIVTGDSSFSFQAFFVTFANSNQFGYNTAIAPDASIDDGLLDVCIVAKPSLISIPLVAYMLFTGRFNRIPIVHHFKSASLKLKQEETDVVNIDGEPVHAGKTLNIKVSPLSLEVIIP